MAGSSAAGLPNGSAFNFGAPLQQNGQVGFSPGASSAAATPPDPAAEGGEAEEEHAATQVAGEVRLLLLLRVASTLAAYAAKWRPAVS